MISKSLILLGYASGIAANNPGCADGPLRLKASTLEKQWSDKGLKTHWQAMLVPQHESKQERLAQVVELNTQLAGMTQHLTEQEQTFIVVGGDHSCAIGTWSGVAAELSKKNAALGLVWIDAHMDSHTFETTPSGNIHGMPLAALLGHGAEKLTQILTSAPKLKPEHVSLIGSRSFESGEAELLRRLGVRIYEMPEIKEKGLAAVLQEAIVRAKQGTVGFGVSLDLDAVDPEDAPGVGVPEPDGINGKDLCQALTLLQQEKQLLGMEIVEYNPHLDKDSKTELLINNIVLSIFGD